MTTETPQFTPAPWVVIDNHIHVPSEGHIARLLNPWGDKDQRQANANLIAAAPDLYAALGQLLKHAGIADAAAEDIDGEDHMRESAARRALAKARGEQ